MKKNIYIYPSIDICEITVDNMILAASIGFKDEISDAVQLSKSFSEPFNDDEEDADSVQYIWGLNY